MVLPSYCLESLYLESLYHPKEVETIYFINFQPKPPSNKNGETSFTMDVVTTLMYCIK